MQKNRFVLICLVVRAAFAAVPQLIRRFYYGPVKSNWSWSLEFGIVITRKFFELMAELPKDKLLVFQRSLTVPFAKSYCDLVACNTETVAGINCQHYRHENCSRAQTILYLHGGAYALTNLSLYQQFISRLVIFTKADVILPDYTSSLCKPFPAALEECFNIYVKLISSDQDRKIVLAGDSAGGGLVLALMLLLRERGIKQPAGAIVISPWADLTLSANTIDKNEKSDLLSRHALQLFAKHYIGKNSPENPLISPKFATFESLPPMLLFAGDAEILLGDAESIAATAQKSGVEVEFYKILDMFHVGMVHVASHADLSFIRIIDFFKNKI